MAAAGTEPRPEPPRVLLAEDDEPFRQLLAAELVGAGFEVVQARDGIELLAQVEALLARHQRPETFVIVSDVQMPGLGGLDVLAVLRCAHLRTPIILITAFGDEETTAEARDHGATAVLRKPFDLASLRARVLDAAPP